MRTSMNVIFSNNGNSKFYFVNNNYNNYSNNIGLKNVHKKRKLQGNLLIKLKNDYFKLKHTSYIQYNIREDIYSITPL
ncbi:hypothetical protein PFUGPA_03106 [Plasmodium falciparum Palo Alto/Uganda]|uniref:Uncharacterized protein n=1 Tax=Plasmodium falciparum (isolate Palo Alto / Uganda) TaxID=57270 RepID=W4IWW5_PLAFP|nr:hypothetical protein PFUGPA_03106 [Plasmodium falciparum Palo Alto/Uganda]